MKTILLTGASGFIGSHIAEDLLSHGYNVVSLKRSSSNLWRCKSFIDRIKWINSDNLQYDAEILKHNPDILIHTAWNGVNSSERDNWVVQMNNISFLIQILEIVKKSNIHKIISLGSQAEYGQFEGNINEDFPCNPNNAYGVIKKCSSEILKAYAQELKKEWYWLRIFSVYGPREDRNWLIPSVITKLLDQVEMNLTPCEQRYDYIYIKDLIRGLRNVVENKEDLSGIYNISSGKTIQLKDLVKILEKILSPKHSLLKLGALPYRPNQVMHMQGNSDKFFKLFNFKPLVEIQDGLNETIRFYQS